MMDLTAIDDEWLDARFKGFPPDAEPVRVRDVAARHWNLFGGALPYPVAVLRASALDHNERWMREFCLATGVSLAPHGKTTMAPQLFARQLAAGAWGITVATVQQLEVAVAFGVRRTIVANQLVGRAEIARVITLVDRHPDLELYFLVDSLPGLARFRELASARAPSRPLCALVEVGYVDGRTGARSPGEALAVARAIAGSAHLRLAGVECYEGLRVTADPGADARNATALLDDVHEVARQADAESLFGSAEVILSAGGSALFDVVARELAAALSKPVRPVLRSGCYVTHDSGFYERQQVAIRARLGSPWHEREGFRAALEVWGQVQSRPQSNLAILDFGRRDASHDMGLPRPRWVHRPSTAASPTAAPAALEVTALNDQHAYLRLPADYPLAVGDLVGCGISHPCTTFDKWRLLWLIDDVHDVIGAVRTYF